MSQPTNRPSARFPLGDVVATPGALEALREAKQEPLVYLRRHQLGDWGDLGAEERGFLKQTKRFVKNAFWSACV